MTFERSCQICNEQEVQGLRLLQANLAHEKYLDEARQRVRELEAEVDALQREQTFKSTTEPQLQVREHHKPRWWFW